MGKSSKAEEKKKLSQRDRECGTGMLLFSQMVEFLILNDGTLPNALKIN